VPKSIKLLYKLCNESKKTILALVGKANKFQKGKGKKKEKKRPLNSICELNE
jgi:hypothetical protein